jgi:hypothetical protein
MRIPISNTDKGYWYPIGDYYRFQLLETAWISEKQQQKYRHSTWEEFKNTFPFPAYPNANYKLRRKIKYKHT